MSLAPKGEHPTKVAHEVDRVQVEVHSKGHAIGRQHGQPHPRLSRQGDIVPDVARNDGDRRFRHVSPSANVRGRGQDTQVDVDAGLPFPRHLGQPRRAPSPAVAPMTPPSPPRRGGLATVLPTTSPSRPTGGR